MTSARALDGRQAVTDPAKSRSIPSLDGLRAISILLVIAAHSSWYLPQWLTHNFVWQSVISGGAHGVTVFFVISGYLITTLLLKELSKTGTIALGHFYFRRSMRIFPVFYVFLAVIAILWAMNILPQDPKSYLAAATYTWALYPHAQGYAITHTWSLSIEEIFYLFWPFLVFTLHRSGKLVKCCLAFIALTPLVRILFYFALPAVRVHQDYMVQGWIDTMMVGCLLALLQHQGRWTEIHRRYIHGWSVSLMALVGFLLIPLLNDHLPKPFSGLMILLVSPTVTALCTGGILMYCVMDGGTLTAKILNSRVLRYIGVRSYSLYLWQQIFMFSGRVFLPWGYLYAILAAEASYLLVERPTLKLRAWMEATYNARRQTQKTSV